MHVCIDAAWCRNQAVTVDDRRSCAHDDVDAVSGVRVAGLADSADAAVTYANACHANAVNRIEDDDIGDEQITGLTSPERPEPHAIAAGLREPHAELITLVIDPGINAQSQSRVTENHDVTLKRAILAAHAPVSPSRARVAMSAAMAPSAPATSPEGSPSITSR